MVDDYPDSFLRRSVICPSFGTCLSVALCISYLCLVGVGLGVALPVLEDLGDVDAFEQVLEERPEPIHSVHAAQAGIHYALTSW